jgi:two-component system sensor histidine kinase KdpD
VARVRSRTEVAERDRRRAALLYELNAALVGGVDLDAILATIVQRVVDVFGAVCSRILVPDGAGALVVRSRFPPDVNDSVARDDLALATWVLDHGEPAGTRTSRVKLRWPHGTLEMQPRRDVSARADTLYLPIATPERSIGVLEVTRRKGGDRFGPEDRGLLGTFATQAALALERARLTESEVRAAALAQSEAIKSALLAAVSHDLRTPLTTIKASVTSLLDTSVAWRPEDRAEFLEVIDEETDRLDRLVANLLDLSRIEGGALQPYKDWHAIADLVDDVVSRLNIIAGMPQVTAAVDDSAQMARSDYDQISRVLMNLGENALKYALPGTPVVVEARGDGETITFSVQDQGTGIDPVFLPHMFRRFTRAESNRSAPGSGLGLAISKGLVEAHGGAIWAESETGKGTTIHFTIPAGPSAGGAG